MGGVVQWGCEGGVGGRGYSVRVGRLGEWVDVVTHALIGPLGYR